MIVVPALPMHVRQVRNSKKQLELRYMRVDDYDKLLCNTVHAYAAIRDRRVLGVFGLEPLSDDRAAAWAVMGEDSAGNMVALTRKVITFLDTVGSKYARVETHVRSNFPEGHKWVKMLGFQYEATCRKFAHGMDFDQYVRFGNG